MTTQCNRLGQPEFVLEADEGEVPDVYLENAVKIIEGMVAQGSVFLPGQTLQIGWMLTQVQAHNSRNLTLLEPDMMSFPIKWVPGITQTLRQMMLQLFMLDGVSLRDRMDVPTIRQSVMVCTRYSEPNFCMSRSMGSNDSDSGWFIGCIDEAHDHNATDNLHCVSVYEAFLHQRAIQGFMSFPVGTGIVIDQKKGILIAQDDEELRLQPRSLLDAYYKKLDSRTHSQNRSSN